MSITRIRTELNDVWDTVESFLNEKIDSLSKIIRQDLINNYEYKAALIESISEQLVNLEYDEDISDLMATYIFLVTEKKIKEQSEN